MMGLLRGFISGLALAIGLVFMLPAQADAPAPAPTKVIAFDPQDYAEELFLQYNWSHDEMACLIPLWNAESHWNYKADNPESTAYGIAQILGETSHDPSAQVRKGLKYIAHRYDKPCTAWQFWKLHNWY